MLDDHERQADGHVPDKQTPTISNMSTPTLYAYRLPADFDYTVAREKGAPTTGWVHAVGGPPWRVIVAESREQAAVCASKLLTVAVYDGDEPTIPITTAWPEHFRARTARP